MLSKKQKKELYYMWFNAKALIKAKKHREYHKDIPKIRENIKYCYERLDELNIPFRVQNNALYDGKTKDIPFKEWIKTQKLYLKRGVE